MSDDDDDFADELRHYKGVLDDPSISYKDGLRARRILDVLQAHVARVSEAKAAKAKEAAKAAEDAKAPRSKRPRWL